jgi:hypothetical protein
MTYSKDTKIIVRNLTRLENKSEPIFKKLKQPYTEIKIHNNKFYISKIDTNDNCFTRSYYDTNETYLCSEFKIIERNINEYKDILKRFQSNYENIKSKLGIKSLKQNNEEFNNMILETEDKLDKLLNKYIDTLL